MHRALVLVVIAAGCTSDAELARQSYVRGAFCPPERVRAFELPELALFIDDARATTPWQEPVPPAGVAADPARLALWQRTRDADHGAWAAREARAAAVTQPASNVQELVGCDGAQLWTCGRGRHGVSCRRVAGVDNGQVLACRDGRAARFSGGVFQCTSEPAFSRTRCATGCPSGEYRCLLDCAATAVDECRRNGLDELGLCGGAAHERDELAKSVAQVASASEYAALSKALESCLAPCKSSSSCTADCLGQAAERCEQRQVGDAVCTRLRSSADTMHRQVEQLRQLRQ
jgi:hypothetical protein